MKDVNRFAKLFEADEVDAALVNAAVESTTNGPRYFDTKGWKRVLDTPIGGTVRVEKIGILRVLKNTYEYDDYDSSPQGGSEFQIVVQVDGDDDRFWSKKGHVDSYGGVEWSTGLERVFGHAKTITVFE